MVSCDVLVVGGGIIGASIAFRLAQEKLRVALLDQQQCGREASWAAAGMLSPVPQSAADIPLVPLARSSLALYPNFLAAVEDASGLRVPCRRQGAIELLFSPDADRELNTLLALHRSLDLPTEPLPLEEARKLEPALGPAARAAALLPYEAAVDSRALTRAVLAAAVACGATIHPDTAVTQVLRDGHRCAGVIAAGQPLYAGTVVLAAGAFSGRIAGLPCAIPTKPVRGQMVALRCATPGIRRVLRSERGYLVPRDDNAVQLLVAGSTLEDAGFDKRVTPQGLGSILSAVQEIAPALAGGEIVETWSGLRPDTPDHLPLLGPTELEGLLLATGHYRNGILLTPVTAQLVCDWLAGRKLPLDCRIFSPLRFAGASAMI